jgi:methionyl-tRNA formyltransferase
VLINFSSCCQNVPAAGLHEPKEGRTDVQEMFLSTLERLEPDLCITAAYGNMLPQRFLNLPPLGTLNIHPSLLPKYRGAAPVNRCLENGDTLTGVSLAYTVLKCDAGPVLAQKEVKLSGDEQAPELLERLFSLGTELLLEKLPEVWSGVAQDLAQAQDEALVSHAAKMAKSDGLLDFSLPAQALHNKVHGPL